MSGVELQLHQPLVEPSTAVLGVSCDFCFAFLLSHTILLLVNQMTPQCILYSVLP